MSAWLERLQPGDLPVFRRTREVIEAMTERRESLTARALASEILADPLATYRLLHTINLKVGERYGTEVTTVEHALMMLGIGTYIDTARRYTLLEDTPAGRDAYLMRTLHALTQRAQHAAWQARDFAVLHADVRAEEVQVAALLHAMPEYLLILRAPDSARQLFRLRSRIGAKAAEMQVLGARFDALRPALLERWHFPQTLLDLFSPRNGVRARQIVLAACLDIAERTQTGWWDEQLIQDYHALAGVENFPIEHIIATVHGNAARAARACIWLSATPAATWAPMIPGPWPPDPEEEALAAEPAQAKGAEQAAPLRASYPPRTPSPAKAPASGAGLPAAPIQPEAPAEPAPAICPMPDRQVFQQTFKSIESHLDGSYSLNQMSAVILKGLHSGLGMSRIVFAMLTPDRSRVRSRFTLGVPVEDPLRHFDFALDSKDLFGQLMGKMQGVWLNPGNRDKLWPMIDPRMRKMIGEGEFFAMSLHHAERPLGLIYADRSHGECGLDPLSYTDFKMLCLQAARGLARTQASA